MSTNKLTETQINAAQDLARGLTKREVAEKYGVNECTIYRWLKKDEFTKEMKNLKEMFIEESKSQLIKSVPDVIGELIRIATKSTRDSNRLGAIKEILEIVGFKSEELIKVLLERNPDEVDLSTLSQEELLKLANLKIETEE